MIQREVIQLLAMQPPLRHGLIHQRRKAIVVLALQQMHQLMRDDVFKAQFRFLDQFQVQPDPARRRWSCAMQIEVKQRDGLPAV